MLNLRSSRTTVLIEKPFEAISRKGTFQTRLPCCFPTLGRKRANYRQCLRQLTAQVLAESVDGNLSSKDTLEEDTEDDSSNDPISLLGLGTWRLRGRMGVAFETLAAYLEGTWREMVTDLGLYPLPPDLKFMDSMDKDKSFGIWSYIDLPDPAKGEEAFPRLLIENRAYRSRVFRKLHMELAHRQDGLQVLHCVLFPHLDYDMPILSFDMVGNETGKVSLAIADPCPATMNRSLPGPYEETVRELQALYKLENNRTIPEWGQAIFSDLCVIVRPEDPEELERFILYSISLHHIHLTFAQHIRPVTEFGQAEQRRADIRAAQERYCEKQMENSKTFRVLEAAFGQEIAEIYMEEVMFDSPDEVAEEGGETADQAGQAEDMTETDD